MLQPVTMPAAPAIDSAGDSGPRDPVFVLCMGRSGSTLLRFVLDSHPDLACPPETRLPALCAHLVAVWTQLDGWPARPEGNSPPQLPAAALAGVRAAVDAMTAPYLIRRGKRRYCDKSLGVAAHAELLAQLFPTATFLCLYRHPMDVIASGIQATPWGLTGFGFDSYAAASPGNAVLALARYWADHAQAILRFEQRHPDRSHRVRYEDLVTDPQGVADGIFDSLGAGRVQGVPDRCFSQERERQGPGDYKIWHTSAIHRDSVGRGWHVPANLITADVTERLNHLVEDLGYLQVDGRWGVAATTPDMRVRIAQPDRPASGSLPVEPVNYPAAHHLIAERLHAGLFQLNDDFANRWAPYSTDAFTLTANLATSATRTDTHTRWRVDLTKRIVASQSGTRAADDAGGASWGISGSTEVWEEVLTGRTNLGLALRTRQLRYCHHGSEQPAAVAARTGMIAELLGVTDWRPR